MSKVSTESLRVESIRGNIRPVPCINRQIHFFQLWSYLKIYYVQAPVVGRCQLASEYNYSRISLLCTTKGLSALDPYLDQIYINPDYTSDNSQARLDLDISRSM